MADPLGVCNSRTRVLLPAGVHEIINARPHCETLGEFGEIQPWPVTRTGRDLSRVANESAKRCVKWFVRGKMPADKRDRAWCALADPNGRLRLKWEFAASQVPHFG